MIVNNGGKYEIRFVEDADRQFWFSLDRHLPLDEFAKKVRDKQGYILLTDNKPVGILRYNLFWDNTPFCNLLYIKEEYQRRGYGKALMLHWENEMRSLGYNRVLVSTQSDENAQYFYRATGYKECGNLEVPNQATELFFCKCLIS